MFDQLFRNMPPVVKNLLLLNVLFFLAQIMLPEFMDAQALRHPFSEEFRPWQLATHFFMHSPHGFMHILFNMFGLVMFGTQLERVWGPKRFLIFYLVCALGAALIYLCYNTIEFMQLRELLEEFKNTGNPDTFREFIAISIGTGEGPYLASDAQIAGDGLRFMEEEIYDPMVSRSMLGASGAIYGILTAFAYLFPNTELMLLFPPIPIKAKWLVLGLVAIGLYSGLSNNPGDNVAHFAHLGGALFGFLLTFFWNKQRNNFY